MADSQSILLDTFRDNNAQLITAADLREFVNAAYAELIKVEKIIDNLNSDDKAAVLSAYQGKILNSTITLLQVTIDANTAKADANALALVDLAGGVTGDFVTATDTISVTNGVITNITPII